MSGLLRLGLTFFVLPRVAVAGVTRIIRILPETL